MVQVCVLYATGLLYLGFMYLSTYNQFQCTCMDDRSRNRMGSSAQQVKIILTMELVNNPDFMPTKLLFTILGEA